eukprot:6191947-Pleurochrysis_carterae.AAC.3
MDSRTGADGMAADPRWSSALATDSRARLVLEKAVRARTRSVPASRLLRAPAHMSACRQRSERARECTGRKSAGWLDGQNAVDLLIFRA